MQYFLLLRSAPMYVVGILTDVGRQSEQSLRDSERRYREVVESQPDFVCRFLPDLTLTFINDAYCRFVCCSKEELLGSKFLSRLPSSLEAPMDNFDALIAVASGGEPFEWDSEFRRADGSATSIHWSCLVTMTAEGGLNEFQAIGRDVTDRKRVEEADRKLAQTMRLASLGELTAVVSHEISQPLAAIINYTRGCVRHLQGGGGKILTIEVGDDVHQEYKRQQAKSNAASRVNGYLSDRDVWHAQALTSAEVFWSKPSRVRAEKAAGKNCRLRSARAHESRATP